jgi:hypothetical protein
MRRLLGAKMAWGAAHAGGGIVAIILEHAFGAASALLVSTNILAWGTAIALFRSAIKVVKREDESACDVD